jgi:peptidoglycan/xylan/chitin deacetylase (PgdA/CDA1 family)
VANEIARRAPDATVSVDVDPVDAHLAGYGVPGAAADRMAYQRAVPRILEQLAACGARATFFWVARDAAANARLLREVAAAGHEVASHTATHPEAWRNMARAEVAHELRVSKEQLEDAAGAPVVGFRSPGWHGPAGLAEELASAGYRYDASQFPSPLLGAAGALIWLRSGGKRRTALGASQWFGRRAPHALTGGLTEFPVSVTRALRLPIYHTLRYALGDARFERALDRFAAEAHPLSYPLHAVDALGLAEDEVDSRMARHPGMRLPLAAKLALLARTLAAIALRFESRPFAERAAGA